MAFLRCLDVLSELVDTGDTVHRLSDDLEELIPMLIDLAFVLC